MAITPAVYARYNDNILLGSTVSGTAPSTSYSLSDLLLMNPAARVRWGSGTVTITFTLGSSKAGAILHIPMHNMVGAVLTLTNGAGLSHAVTPPALRADGFPFDLLIDFSADSNRTSNVWNLVISGNPSNVQFGGAVAIYTSKRTLSSVTPTGQVSWQYNEKESYNADEVVNEYGTPYIQDYATFNDQIEVTAVGKVADIQALLDWFRDAHGRVRPSLLWFDPTVATCARFGRWQKQYDSSSLTYNRRQLKITFDAWSKGKPFAA